jgi:alcohol dehydrogenase class IV
MRFEFTTATQVVFGPGTLAEAGRLAKALGRRAALVVGKKPQRAQRLVDELAEARITTTTIAVSHEPTVDDVVSGAAAARRFGAEMVIGMGGGSVMDAAKAISALLTNEDSVFDYIEIVGKGQPLELPAAPWIAIPTTAGTGAEATRNSVLTVPERGLKVSLRSPYLLARLAIIDPELTLDMPAALTASTGMDALSQLIEAYLSTKANPMTDSLCAAGIPRAAHALPVACAQPRELSARTDLALASLWSGMALANAGLGGVHGLASPIGGMFRAPHGAICGALLGPIMGANIRALRSRQPDSPALIRYAEIARWLTRRIDAQAEDGAVWINHLVSTLQLPKLSALKVPVARAAEVVTRAMETNSMKTNPIELSVEEITAALNEAL